MKYSSISEYLLSVKESKYTVLVIIYLAFFLDNMLLTVVGKYHTFYVYRTE